MRKIIIIGTGAGSERTPSGELWGLSGHWDSGKKFNRIYELHSANALNGMNIIKPKGDWMRENVTHTHHTLKKACFPDAEVFDFDKYLNKYGRSAFRCSVSWMLAEAIEEKPDAIEIYGVTLSGKEEYRAQKPSVAAFVLVARALGIKVYVDREDELFSCPWIYGLEDKPGYITALEDRKKKLQRDKFNAESDVLEMRAKFNTLEGMEAAFEWLTDSYGI